jgi:radical SAM/Cys-rich protein
MGASLLPGRLHRVNRFTDRLQANGISLRRTKPRILQINLGKVCNMTCTHCHVNAGPTREEVMTRETMDRVVDWLAETEIPTVDLTGGAPEMVPDFRYLIDRLRALQPSRRIIDRCNLTILLEPAYSGVAEFLAAKKVEIVASLPFYSPGHVSLQRGEGAFDMSIRALRLLNRLGYGVAGDLPLHLAYNPVGLQLPAEASQLQADFKRELATNFGIIFNNLYVVTNVPVGRFATVLRLNNKFDLYLDRLMNAFNVAAVDGVVCRDSINIGWRGEVYDCDFNQQLGMQWRNGHPNFLWDVDPATIEDRAIMTGDHCFACTANGSGCHAG